MTETEHRWATRLAGCRFLPASTDKRFAQSMAARSPCSAPLTPKQRAFFGVLLYRYRRQLRLSDAQARQAQQEIHMGMSEQEYLACTDPQRLLAWLREPVYQPLGQVTSGFFTGSSLLAGKPRISERQLRFFACAWWSAWEPHTKDHADRAARAENWESNDWQNLLDEMNPVGMMRAERATLPPPALGAALLRCICGNPWRSPATYHTYRVRRRSARHLPPGARPMVPVMPEHDEFQVPLPWWKEVLTWNGGAVVRLAEVIYQERSWHLLPILADALEDAGCGDVEILNHCRGLERCWDRDGTCAAPWHPLRGPHARGCWVLSLLLGQS